MRGLLRGWPLVGSVWTRNDFDFHGMGGQMRPGETVTVNSVGHIHGDVTQPIMVRYTRNKNGVRQYGWHLSGFLRRFVCSRSDLPWIGEGI